MRGAFLIEAEDFNFDSGKHVAAASTMPYTGNAYTNITTQVLDVDYWNDGDESGNAAFAYGRFAPDGASENVVELKGPADPADYLRGDFSVTHNYAVGWTDTADWQNYTRVFPEGTYVAYGGVAYDGRTANQINMYLSKVANPTIADGTVAGTEGGQQGLTRLGSFTGPATGAWSSNDILPLRDDAGNVAQFQLGGTNTIRWTHNKPDGDEDFLLLYRLGAAPTNEPPTNGLGKLSAVLSGTDVTISWTGAGTLQEANRVGPGTTWSNVPGVTGTQYVAPIASGTNRFFRLTGP
jgi:hypothetical protein